MYMVCVSKFLYSTCMQEPVGPEEDIGSPGNMIIGSCEPSSVGAKN